MVKRRGRTTRSVGYQRGKTNVRRDKKRSAMKPGRRLSRNRKKYTETRKNRSDLRGRI